METKPTMVEYSDRLELSPYLTLYTKYSSTDGWYACLRVGNEAPRAFAITPAHRDGVEICSTQLFDPLPSGPSEASEMAKRWAARWISEATGSLAGISDDSHPDDHSDDDDELAKQIMSAASQIEARVASLQYAAPECAAMHYDLVAEAIEDLRGLSRSLSTT